LGLVDRSPRRQSKDAGGIAGQTSLGVPPGTSSLSAASNDNGQTRLVRRRALNRCSLLPLLASLVPSLQGRSSLVPILVPILAVVAP
jgi:hypothetical protein